MGESCVQDVVMVGEKPPFFRVSPRTSGFCCPVAAGAGLASSWPQGPPQGMGPSLALFGTVVSQECLVQVFAQ